MQNRREFFKITGRISGFTLAGIMLSKNRAIASAFSFYDEHKSKNPLYKNLRCEYLKFPLGIDDLHPALSWTIDDERRGVMQTSYRILAASNPEILALNKGDLWDSGTVKSAACYLIPYQGKALDSGQRCFWKVRVNAIDIEGEEHTGWSEPGEWEMGLLNQEDWQGKWIQAPDCKPINNEVTQLWTRMTLIPQEYNVFKNDEAMALSARKKGEEMVGNIYPAPAFRTSFTIKDKVVKARLYISGLGFQEAFINGKPVSDNMFDPSVTNYNAGAGYITHDVTRLIDKGINFIAVVVGSGWFHEALIWGNPKKVFGAPGLIAQLEIKFSDGKRMSIATDKTWQTAIGPIVKSDYYAGEAYDAQRAKGWKTGRDKDNLWKPAIEAQHVFKRLTAQKCEPERIIRRVKPVNITEPKPGIYVVDFGELIVGTIELDIKAPAGTTIIMRTAEVVWGEKNQGKKFTADLLYYDGFKNTTFTNGMIASKPRGGGYYAFAFKAEGMDKSMQLHLGCPTIVYVASGDDKGEIYRPSFTIHAMRYVEVQGLKPDLETITGLVITNDDEVVGAFNCDNQDFNRIFEACMNSTRYNTHGMSWDNCVERLQSQVLNAWSAPFASYILYYPNLWEKLLEDQRSLNVLTPNTEKFTGTIYGKRWDPAPIQNPVTEGVTVELPIALYTRYGDQQELSKHYPDMKVWCEAYFPENDGQIIKSAKMNFWNDHFYIETSADCEWTPEWDQKAFMSMLMYKNILNVAKAARILNKINDAIKLETLAEKVRKVTNQKWYNASQKTYGAGINKKTKKIDSSTGWHGLMALAISTGVAPEADVPDLISNCIKDMKEKYRSHHAAGHITHQLLYDVYSDNGLIETCYDMMNSSSYPGFKWILAQSGSHTISEGPTMPEYLPSQHSVCQNECQEPARWFTETLCGISPDINEPAFKHIWLRPKFPSRLPAAQLTTHTAYGYLESSWQQKDGMITWKVSIPANSYATAWIPAAIQMIKAGNLTLDKTKGCLILAKNANEVKCRLSSGEYTFVFPMPQNKPSLLSNLRDL